MGIPWPLREFPNTSVWTPWPQTHMDWHPAYIHMDSLSSTSPYELDTVFMNFLALCTYICTPWISAWIYGLPTLQHVHIDSLVSIGSNGLPGIQLFYMCSLDFSSSIWTLKPSASLYGLFDLHHVHVNNLASNKSIWTFWPSPSLFRFSALL